jgi:hypothetical protein
MRKPLPSELPENECQRKQNGNEKGNTKAWILCHHLSGLWLGLHKLILWHIKFNSARDFRV